MKYPVELYSATERILGGRRQDNGIEFRNRLQKILDNNTVVRSLYFELNRLQAEKAFMFLTQKEGLDEQISTVKARLENQLKAIGLTANDLFDEKYTCDSCRDRGTVDGSVCDCKKRILAQLNYDEMIRVSNIKNCVLEDFDHNYYEDTAGIDKVLKSCVKYASEFTSESKNLMFMGATGLGKTYLSLMIANDVIDRNYYVMYCSAGTLINDLSRARFHDDEEAQKYRQRIYDCELLILDDLGCEMTTKHSVAEIYELINSRINNHLPTIISTNLSLQEVERMYTERVLSRLVGHYEIVPFSGEDIRIQKAKERKRGKYNEKKA